MKLLCQECELYLDYEAHEEVAPGALGVDFRCSGCSKRVSLVTNAGETMLVRSFGIQLGGRQQPPEPLELTTQMLSGAPAQATLSWDDGAQRRLDRIPPFVRPMVREEIESFARRQGHARVTETVIDAYKAHT